MKRVRFSDERIVRILQEADRNPIAEIAKLHGISEPQKYSMCKNFGDLGTNDVQHLEQLKQDNARYMTNIFP